MARGLKVAIDYLNSFYPIKLVPEELKTRAGLDCMSNTLARKLRDNTNRLDPLKGRVIVSYEPDKDGRNEVAHYQGNPTFIAPERKSKREDTPGVNPIHRKTAPAVFFFETLQNPGIFSPYYTSILSMKEDIIAKSLEAVHFTGSHDKPVKLP